MRDSRQGQRGRQQAGYVRGGASARPAPQGTRTRAPAPGAYAPKGQPARQKKAAVNLGGVSIPLPAIRIGTALLILAVTVAIVAGLAKNASQNNLKSNTITAGVKIDGKDVSGLDADKLGRDLNAQYNNRINSVSVTIKNQGKTIKTLNGKDIGMSDNVNDVVAQAAVLARSGSVEDRQAEAKQIKAEGRNFPVTLTIDANALRIKLTEIANSLAKPGQDATVSFNADVLDFVDPDNPTDEELAKIPSMFKINTESAGQTVDVEGLEQQILEALKSADKCTVDMVVKQFTPKVTAAMLKNSFHILSVFSTHISGASTAERISNIRTALAKFDSMTLEPGQELSFNDTTGPRTAANGYKMAHVINNNQYVDDWGGGVCQASSTLYNAAVLAGMNITDSGPHSIPSDYIKLVGFDAMVNYPNGDLKFVNPYDTPVYIKTFITKKNNVYAMFFGAPLPDGETIERQNQIVSQGPKPETDTVVDKDGTYADYVTYLTDSYQVMLPHPQIDVISYRVYKDKNGTEIKRDKLREDHYKEIRGLIVIGSKQPPDASAAPTGSPKASAGATKTPKPSATATKKK